MLRGCEFLVLFHWRSVMNWLKIGLFCVFMIAQILPITYARKRIVKLIVPHTIKYIHHTHVLLVKPRKKKKAHISSDEYEDDYDYHHVAIPTRKLRYALEANDKEGNYGALEEYDPYNIMPIKGHRSRKVTEKARKTSKGRLKNQHHREKVPHSAQYHQRYQGQYQSEGSSSKYTVSPYMQDQDYLGQYDSYTDHDPAGLATEEGGWGADSYTLPERVAGGNYFRQSSYVTIPISRSSN